MKKTIFVFLILFVTAYFFAGSVKNLISGEVIKEAADDPVIPNDFGDINVYFCQVDDCEAVLVNKIKESKKIDCAFFELGLELVEDALREKEYRLILDDRNLDKTDLNAIGDERSALMHNKFCIYDDRFVSTGSFNPTLNDAKKNDNNLVIIESISLVRNYKDEFEEMSGGNFGKGDFVEYPKINFNGNLMENYFCPEDSCEEQTLKLLRNAKERIYFMTFSFTSDKIGEEVIKNFHYGIDVRGVFEKFQAGNEYSEFSKMRELGMDVKLDSNPKNMHHKVFVIDNETVITGSFNPSQNADISNDENLLIIHDEDISKMFLDEFRFVWPSD